MRWWDGSIGLNHRLKSTRKVQIEFHVGLDLLMNSLTIFRMIGGYILPISNSFSMYLILYILYLLIKCLKRPHSDNILQFLLWDLISRKFPIMISFFFKPLNILQGQTLIMNAFLMPIFEERNKGTIDDQWSYFITEWLFLRIDHIKSKYFN